jgi:aspartokinase
MKKHSLFAALPVLLLTILLMVVSGCDWVRASLGKPTSADLAALRMAKEAREQAVRDSIAAAKAEQERIAAEEAAAAAAAAAVPKRYYAVAGAFKEDVGAQIFEEKLRENGFRVRTFD